ncbi:uncharacterized protein [Diabrotica undecimpunctata]|uniref:uncharacterized protein n=1 Tax=Diabrotica undecimpunctata TaxID=50387 RepID=UPI003B638328
MAVMCKICKKILSSQSCLNRHNKKVHNQKKTEIISYELNVFNSKCFECAISFKFIKDLRTHLQDKHNVAIEMIEITFNDSKEFDDWLEDINKKEKTEYVLTRGCKLRKTDDGTVKMYYYHCNRSYKKCNIIQDEVRKRLPKIQGSEKLLFSCTSQIISSQLNNGKCIVTYYKSHYHHDNEIRHLHLSKIDKNQVANKLLAGVSVSK